MRISDWSSDVCSADLLVVAVGIRQAGDLQLKDDLTRLTRARVRLVVAEGAEIESKINQVYRAEGELDDLTSDLVTDEPGESDLAGFTEVAEDAPVVRFVNLRSEEWRVGEEGVSTCRSCWST